MSRPPGRCGIDQGVGPASRRQHQRAAAGRKGLGRLPVKGHDPDLVAFYFDCNDSSLAAIDEAEPETFMDSGWKIQRGLAVDGVDRQVSPWDRLPGAIAVPSGAEPPVLDQQYLVAIDAGRLILLDHQRPRPRRPGPGRHRAARDRTGTCRREPMEWRRFRLAPGRQRRRAAVNGSVAGTPSMPCQLSTVGTGSLLPKRDFQPVAAPEAPARVRRRT